MSTDHRGSLDHGVPQWKRELILRRRAVGRVLPAGTGSVQLTCPSVVVAVRYPEYSPSSDSHFKTCPSDREHAAARKNMRLVEQVNASPDFAEPGLLPDFKKYSKSDSSAGNYLLKMGEEKHGKKKKSCDSGKKSSGHLMNDDDDGGGDDSFSDSSEELKYGPGIVSRLKSRYLSLTLRESQGRTRPALPYMRRATSLENILDGPEVEKCEMAKPKYVKNVNAAVNGSVTERYRSLTRGNKDSMKRAGSVETLIRYDRGRGITVYNRRTYEIASHLEHHEPDQGKPVRTSISSAVEEKELPPPDVVKHTLKIFENSTKLAKNVPLCKVNAITKSINDSNLVCGKKPTVFPKPLVSGNVKKCVGDKLKNSENVSRGLNEAPGKVSEKVKVEEESHQEKKVIKTKKTSPEKGGKATSVKAAAEKPPAPGDGDALPPDSTDGEVTSKPVSPPTGKEGTPSDCVPPVDITSLLNNNTRNSNNQNNNIKQKSTGNASPEEHGKTTCLSPEPLRSLSPVLVRAPPCILSSEVNANTPTSPTQQHHMKQLGVVRPLVTNKTSHSGQTFPHHKCSPNKPHPVLTEREIEKNLINSVKSIEQPVTKVIVSLKKSPEECILPCVNDGKQNEESKRGLIWDSRKANTMVFNFSNRKTVPDYIENDGLILTSRKDKPKGLEPGIIFLGGSTYDSSSDFDPEDLISDPPSPCDFTFEGDNILINGKSNIQSKPKLIKMKIQFNDDATTMFEYPSEASLLDDQEAINVDPVGEQSGSSVNGNSAAALPSPFRCSSLASYTPSKVTLSREFQLGVTKAVPTSPTPRQETKQQPEVEEEYLRPADDSTTVTWSSQTAADLLF